MFPSTGGGTEFTGGTFDPSLGYYIINYADTGHISELRRVDDDPDRSGYSGPPESTRIYWHVVTRLAVDGWPCWQPPWSRLVAVDVNTGEIAWTIPFGTVEGAPPGVATGAPNSQRVGRPPPRGACSSSEGPPIDGSAPTRRRPGASCGASERSGGSAAPIRSRTWEEMESSMWRWPRGPRC